MLMGKSTAAASISLGRPATERGARNSLPKLADNDAGTWRIELTLNYPVLILRTNQGSIYTHTLTLVKGFLNIDGEEASLGASDRKR